MVRRALMLEGPRTLTLHEQHPQPLGRRDVRLRSLLSGISHGTELSLYRGSSAFDAGVFDRELRSFVAPDVSQSIYPAKLGYELVGVVEEVGDNVHELEIGDRVHAGTSHREDPVLNLDEAARASYPLVALPSEGPLQQWLFVSLGAVALVAMHDARIKLGDHVAVFGLGAIGLLAVQMARLAGAGRVRAVDPVAERRELALGLGADEALDPGDPPEGVGATIKASRGAGVDIAIETSGDTGALHDAIASARLGGTVVTVGFYQGGAADLRLGEEWHHNRLEMVSSMGAWDAPHRAYPAWDRARVMRTVVGLLDSGRLRVDHLPVRCFPFDDAVEAYRWLDANPNQAVKVALTYDGASSSPGGQR